VHSTSFPHTSQPSRGLRANSSTRGPSLCCSIISWKNSGFLLCWLCGRFTFHHVESLRVFPVGILPLRPSIKNSFVGQYKPPWPVPRGALHHVRVWQYLNPHAFSTSNACGKYFCVVHRYRSQFSAAMAATGSAAISEMVMVSYGISYCLPFGLLSGVATPHFPYLHGGSAIIVLYLFVNSSSLVVRYNNAI